MKGSTCIRVKPAASELEIVSEDENCLCAAPGVDAVLKIQFNQGCARVSAAT